MSTSIEWTDETWNPVRGCALVSAGCANCYAMKQAHRFNGPGQPYEGLTELGPQGPRWNGNIRLVPDVLDAPLHWQKPRRIFVNSMSDLFHEDVPDEFIVAVFGVMAACPEHTFQILTKRPERMRQYFDRIGKFGGFGRYIRSIRVDGDRTIPNLFSAVAKTEIVRGKRCRATGDPWMKVFNAASFHMNDGRLRNVWLGVSVEDQKTADERIPILLQAPAAVRFVSAEPLLGPVDLAQCVGQAIFWRNVNDPDRRLDWIIAGGESGPGARPCGVAWIRSIVQQCRAAAVPCFVKQLGAYAVLDPRYDRSIPGWTRRLKDGKGAWMEEWPADLRVREWPR